jgi:hypothetical protein
MGLDRGALLVLEANRGHQIARRQHLGDLYQDSGSVFTDELAGHSCPRLCPKTSTSSGRSRSLAP